MKPHISVLLRFFNENDPHTHLKAICQVSIYPHAPQADRPGPAAAIDRQRSGKRSCVSAGCRCSPPPFSSYKGHIVAYNNERIKVL